MASVSLNSWYDFSTSPFLRFENACRIWSEPCSVAAGGESRRWVPAGWRLLGRRAEQYGRSASGRRGGPLPRDPYLGDGGRRAAATTRLGPLVRLPPGLGVVASPRPYVIIALRVLQPHGELFRVELLHQSASAGCSAAARGSARPANLQTASRCTVVQPESVARPGRRPAMIGLTRGAASCRRPPCAGNYDPYAGLKPCNRQTRRFRARESWCTTRPTHLGA